MTVFNAYRAAYQRLRIRWYRVSVMVRTTSNTPFSGHLEAIRHYLDPPVSWIPAWNQRGYQSLDTGICLASTVVNQFGNVARATNEKATVWRYFGCCDWSSLAAHSLRTIWWHTYFAPMIPQCLRLLQHQLHRCTL